MKCPHCNQNIDVRLIKAPANLQKPAPSNNGGSDDIGELLDQTEGRSMTQWEETFISDLRSRYVQYGDRTKVTEKQMAILHKIASGNGGDEF